jgi:hypothetical protein
MKWMVFISCSFVLLIREAVLLPGRSITTEARRR